MSLDLAQPSPRSQGVWRYHLGKLFYASPLYGLTLSSRPPGALEVVPPDPWPGDARRGAALLKGSVELLDRTVAGQRMDWRPVGIGDDWVAELHGFDWLRDLRTVGGDAARRGARELIDDWMARHKRWDALVWRPDVLGRRLAAWLGCHDFFCASADDAFRRRCLASLQRQSRHLRRVLPHAASGAELIAALKGLIAAGLCLPGLRPRAALGLRLLARQLPIQVLPDGGHVSRNPATHARVLRDLVDIRSTLLAARAEVPEALMVAIDRMAPYLRMMRHGDGGLALFNGAREEEPWLLDMLLAQADARGRPPQSAPHSGYERIVAGRTLVLADVGAPPPRGFDAHAHAGTLSFELSVGKERLIANCGAMSGAQDHWLKAQRATAAHSTLALDDTNSTEVLREGGLGRRPRKVTAHREEADGNVWLDLAHDGYVDGAGLVHRRRLYLSAAGDDLRGHDRLILSGGATQAERFAARFHLHPAVKASLVQDGAVLLRLPGGGGWQFKADGPLAIAESVALGGSDAPRRAEQIVVSGPLGAPDSDGVVAAVKWALKRVAKKG